MQGGDLTDARLHGADLRQTDFSGARWIDGRKICAEKSIGQCN
ncbi:MAG TPA: pentapeptide repeat-containing protein [Azospirillaceae bacterium]|nr:pentapeptide repeat-containing protein [Azospirillaceae bacterium]